MAWEDFLGQDEAVAFLKAYINSGKIPNAFIFSGIKGVGKFSLAKEFARACNCDKDELNACGKCLSCIQIEQETHPDLFITRPSGKGGEITIDMIRELQHFLNLSPQVAERKFFIIDEADKMNIESSNSFLKGLEEPPLDSVIILVSSNLNSLLLTIKSRAQEIKFHPLSKVVIKTILEKKFNFESTKADYLSGISQGSMYNALKFEGLDAFETIREIAFFLRPAEFLKEKGAELYEQRVALKERIEYVVLLLRDVLYLKTGLPELVILAKGYGISAFQCGNVKDIIAKIEKLEYLYNALDSNVNPGMVYKIVREIWQQAGIKNEIFGKC
mgnify:CR=1 FL=1